MLLMLQMVLAAATAAACKPRWHIAACGGETGFRCKLAAGANWLQVLLATDAAAAAATTC